MLANNGRAPLTNGVKIVIRKAMPSGDMKCVAGASGACVVDVLRRVVDEQHSCWLETQWKRHEVADKVRFCELALLQLLTILTKNASLTEETQQVHSLEVGHDGLLVANGTDEKRGIARVQLAQ